MSHEMSETTGARLTDVDIAELQRCVDRSGKYADEWLISPDDVAALLADRAALTAENARLQKALETQTHGMRYLNDACKRRDEQIASMRPLVEALAAGECAYNDSTDDLTCIHCGAVAALDWDCAADEEPEHKPDCLITQARALVATWTSGQTEPQKGGESHADR